MKIKNNILYSQDNVIIIDTVSVDSGSASTLEAAAAVSEGSISLETGTAVSSPVICSSGALNFNDTDVLGTLRQIQMLLFILVVIIFAKFVHGVFLRVFERLSGRKG